MRTDQSPLTDNARLLLAQAAGLAQKGRRDATYDIHLLRAILEHPPSYAAHILDEIGVDAGYMLRTLTQLERNEMTRRQCRDIATVVRESQAAAKREKSDFVGTEHVLLGILRSRGELVQRSFERSGVAVNDAIARAESYIRWMKDQGKRRRVIDPQQRVLRVRSYVEWMLAFLRGQEASREAEILELRKLADHIRDFSGEVDADAAEHIESQFDSLVKQNDALRPLDPSLQWNDPVEFASSYLNALREAAKVRVLTKDELDSIDQMTAVLNTRRTEGKQ